MPIYFVDTTVGVKYKSPTGNNNGAAESISSLRLIKDYSLVSCPRQPPEVGSIKNLTILGYQS